MDFGNIGQNVLYTIPLILSLSIHEWAHAWSAFKLGDDTAAQAGRLTLNPLVHIDPIGTLLLPLMGVPFGWAKPVPVNPARFGRHVTMNTGMAITAAAGPISNILLAVTAAVVWGLTMRFVPEMRSNVAADGLVTILILQNIGLALFNMIPVPPLDGSRLLERALSYRHRELWETIERFSPILLIAAFIGARFVLAGPLSYLFRLLNGVTHSIAGLT